MADPLPPDPWKTLGVERNATPDSVKKAYRKAVLRCHPDKTKDPAAIEEFHKIQTAYDILTDDEKRQQYEATLRLHALRRDIQGSRSSTFPSPRDFSHAAPRPSAFDEKPRSRTDFSTGWSSRGYFTSEERVPPKSADVPPPQPQPRSTPMRQSTFDDDYMDLHELNRSTSRKDSAHYASTRRPATSKSTKSSDSKSNSKPDKTSSKEKARNETKKTREREVQQDRGRKFSAASAAMPESDSSDDSRRNRPSTSSRSQQEAPRRRSDTTGARAAAAAYDSRRSDDENSFRPDKLKEQEHNLRKHRASAETNAPPPSYRAPAMAEATSEGRRSSRDARPSLFRRSSSRTATAASASAAPKEPVLSSSSRPPSRRASPVRRSSRSRAAMDPPTDTRRPPAMPTSYSSPAGAGIRLPDDMRGRSYDDLPRRRPSLRPTETMPPVSGGSGSPRSSAERVEREQREQRERDRIYESANRDRSSARVRSSRNETLERSASDGHRQVPSSSRRNLHDDAAPPVSSGLRYGENNDSGYSTSSPSETPVDQFVPPPSSEPKKKVYSYASPSKQDDPYVAEVRAPAGSRRNTSPAPRDSKKTSYPPSASFNERSRTTPSRSTSFSSSTVLPAGLSRRSSHRADSSARPRPSLVTRNETMPLPARSRDVPLQPSPTQGSFKVSDGRGGYLFGEKVRATSPEDMERSPRDSGRRETSYRMPVNKVAYAKNYSSDDVAYAPNTGSIGRQGSSGRNAYVPEYQYVRPRRDDAVYMPHTVASPS